MSPCLSLDTSWLTWTEIGEIGGASFLSQVLVTIWSMAAVRAPTAADRVPTGTIAGATLTLITGLALTFRSLIVCFRAKVIRFRIWSRPDRTQADNAERNTFISAASYLKTTRCSPTLGSERKVKAIYHSPATSSKHSTLKMVVTPLNPPRRRKSKNRWRVLMKKSLPMTKR